MRTFNSTFSFHGTPVDVEVTYRTEFGGIVELTRVEGRVSDYTQFVLHSNTESGQQAYEELLHQAHNHHKQQEQAA